MIGKDARWARQGNFDHEVVDKYFNYHPYTNHALPKTKGREMFGDGEAPAQNEAYLAKSASKHDNVFTITRTRAQNIVRQNHTFGRTADSDEPVGVQIVEKAPLNLQWQTDFEGS